MMIKEAYRMNEWMFVIATIRGYTLFVLSIRNRFSSNLFSIETGQISFIFSSLLFSWFSGAKKSFGFYKQQVAEELST